MAVENGRGGEISSMELAAALQKYYKVTFVHTNLFTGKGLLSNEAIKKKLKNVKISARIKFATLNLSNKLFSFPLPNQILKIYRMVSKNNIVYISYSDIKTTLMFLLFNLVKRQGKLIIGYRKPLHSDKLFSLYNIKYRCSILLLSLFTKRIYHHALSLNAKKFLDKFYSPEKVVHIVHGIDLEKYTEEKKEKSTNILKFVYIGYFDDIHKGLGILLKAIDLFIRINENVEVSFEFCGMGPLEKNVRDLEMKYPKYVHYHGYINNDLIHNYYKKGDVFLFSSRVEPFPRAIMEALAAKLIILSSKTIGSVELLKGRKFAFFIEELKPKIICKKLLELYNLWKTNLEEFKFLQNLAKEYVFKNFSSAKEIDMFRNLINRIVYNNS
ncbi:MAG: glycosyltransferase family 4 protein [Promethearchaeota archaeon]